MKLGPALCLLGLALGQAAVPRRVKIEGKQFVQSDGHGPIVLGGPNVVVKGPPWLPAVSGDTICRDVINSECGKTGSCSTCTTFNQADIDHIKSQGWNFIRLGTVWAGAQPRDEDALDPDFLQRLHAILNLTDANGIHVMLDNHGDMVGTLGCGNGAPAWFQKKAAPDLVGKRPTTAFPYNLDHALRIETLSGYAHCPEDSPKWAEFAGDPNYNLLNECCQHLNTGGNPQQIGFTEIQQTTMDYMIKPGPGRDYFVRFWQLMAEAVKDHPSAFGFELANEPITIRRRWMFDAWKACADAITQVVPDASVSVADVGEGSILPAWFIELTGGAEDISDETEEWIKKSNTAFYAWHYGDRPTNLNNMQELSEKWNLPTFLTEGGCRTFWLARDHNVSHSYWHYSDYCNTNSMFGNKTLVNETFGACILGWGSANTSKCATRPQEEFIV